MFFTSEPDSLDSHDVGGESASLIRADKVAASHGLGRIRPSDQVAIRLQGFDRGGIGDGYSHRKTFRYGHNNHGDANDEGFQDALKVVRVTEFDLLTQVDIAYKANAHRNEGEHGCTNTNPANNLDDLLELFLKWSGIIFKIH